MWCNGGTRTRVLATAGAMALATALAAQTMPKLPDGLALSRSADSPGQVTFNHSTHVDTSRPDCTVCHPKPFPILKAGPGVTRTPILHAKMDKGQQCGACHDGKKAFALADDCTLCYKEAGQ